MEYIKAKTIVTKNKNLSWFGTEYNMNIYRGCCHGCIYCDSRSDCYHVEDFSTVKAKENALEIIERELKSKMKKGVVASGSMSDPYNPCEKELKLTRQSLELLHRYGFGAAVATKSDLIVRDIDVFKKIKEYSPVLCKITITTADDKLSRYIEPNVSSTANRFKAIDALSLNGIFCGVLMMPVLPFINDNVNNILSVVRMSKHNGAQFVFPGLGVTLRDSQREYFYSKMKEQTRKKYESRYGDTYSCLCPEADKLYYSFRNECEKLGIMYKMKDIIESYKKDYTVEQLSLF